MNVPQRPFPRPPEPGPDIVTIMLRMEKAVRQYRWLTYVNVIMFGGNMAFMLVVFVAQWWLRH